MYPRNKNIIFLIFNAHKPKASLGRHITAHLHICRKWFNLSLQINADLSLHGKGIQHFAKILFFTGRHLQYHCHLLY